MSVAPTKCHRDHHSFYGYVDINGIDTFVYLGNSYRDTVLSKSLVVSCCEKHLLGECDTCTSELMWYIGDQATIVSSEIGMGSQPMQKSPDCSCESVLKYIEVRDRSNGKVKFILEHRQSDTSTHLTVRVSTPSFGVCGRGLKCAPCNKFLYNAQKTFRQC